MPNAEAPEMVPDKKIKNKIKEMENILFIFGHSCHARSTASDLAGNLTQKYTTNLLRWILSDESSVKLTKKLTKIMVTAQNVSLENMHDRLFTSIIT